jgi:hypothetical protein
MVKSRMQKLSEIVSILFSRGGGGTIPPSALTFAMKERSPRGLHVAKNWKDWVENWAGDFSACQISDSGVQND